MKYSYKQAFDAVHMSTESQEQIRAGLFLRKPRPARRLRPAVLAAVLILSLFLVVGFGYGSQIVQLLGGGWIESGKSGGGYYTSIPITESSPVEVIDGLVFFILDGANIDITSYCTETTYFEYEQISDNGYRHVFIVGGAPDNLGWAEFIWDENGNMIGSTATYHPGENDEQPEWFSLARATLLRAAEN